MNRRAFITIAAVAIGLMCHEVRAQVGQISGIVTDKSGTPVAYARVSPQLLGFHVMHTLRIIVNADDKGRFKIGGLTLGDYAVYAFKEADGYPDTSIPLYRTRVAPKAQLTAHRPTVNVTVLIGPKAGIFAASVRDAITHRPLAPQVVLEKADGSPELYRSEPADFEVLIPAGKDTMIEIREPGYESWSYGKGVSAPPLRLRSGERVNLNVNLAPVTKGEKRGP